MINQDSVENKNNQNKNIVGIVVLIIVLAAGGYFLYKNNLGKQSGKINLELELQKQAAEIIKKQDFSECEKINDEIYKTVCKNNIALNLTNEKQDISYCGKIDDKLIPKADCERRVIFAKSIEKENIDVCKETSNAEIQKQCEGSFYTQLALKKNDIKICDQSSEKDKADFCYNNFLVMKEFTTNTKNFDCRKIRGDEAQNDCKALKESLNAKDQDRDLCASARLKTNLFISYCFIK